MSGGEARSLARRTLRHGHYHSEARWWVKCPRCGDEVERTPSGGRKARTEAAVERTLEDALTEHLTEDHGQAST